MNRLEQVGGLPLVESQAGQVERNGILVENSHDHLLAVDGGNRVDAEVTRLSPDRNAMAPSWGMRFSAMSILASTLSRERIMMKIAFDGEGSS